MVLLLNVTVRNMRGGKILLYYRRCLCGHAVIFDAPTRVYEDNAAAVTFAEKGTGPRSLHWDVKLQYVRELQKVHKIINVVPIATDLQIADVLTKALGIDQHLRLSELLMGAPLVFD